MHFINICRRWLATSTSNVDSTEFQYGQSPYYDSPILSRPAGPPTRTHLCFITCALRRVSAQIPEADTGSTLWRIVQSQRSNSHLKVKVGSLRSDCVYRIYCTCFTIQFSPWSAHETCERRNLAQLSQTYGKGILSSLGLPIYPLGLPLNHPLGLLELTVTGLWIQFEGMVYRGWYSTEIDNYYIKYTHMCM